MDGRDRDKKKEIEGWLTANFKTGKLKVYSRKPVIKNGYEIPILIKLNMFLPEQVELKVETDVTLTTLQMDKMTIEALKEGEYDKS